MAARRSSSLPRTQAWWAALLLLAGGCSPRVDAVPESAHAQIPRGAPNAAWQGRGRLEVVMPTGSRISCTAIVRGMGDGSARAVFLSDEGIILADLTAAEGTYAVIQSIPALDDALPHIGRLFAQAFAAPPSEVRSWSDDRLIAQSGEDQRWYGGDPLLLRCVTGHHFDIYLEDYRQLGGELLAWEVRGEGPLGLTLRIRLQEASSARSRNAGAAAPAPSPAPAPPAATRGAP
jgi:hypothetical protein